VIRVDGPFDLRNSSDSITSISRTGWGFDRNSFSTCPQLHKSGTPDAQGEATAMRVVVLRTHGALNFARRLGANQQGRASLNGLVLVVKNEVWFYSGSTADPK
jgi:hypothetical protein